MYFLALPVNSDYMKKYMIHDTTQGFILLNYCTVPADDRASTSSHCGAPLWYTVADMSFMAGSLVSLLGRLRACRFVSKSSENRLNISLSEKCFRFIRVHCDWTKNIRFLPVHYVESPKSLFRALHECIIQVHQQILFTSL